MYAVSDEFLKSTILPDGSGPRRLPDSRVDRQRRACGLAGFVGRRRYHPRCAANPSQLQIESTEFGINDRRLKDDEIAPGADVHRITLRLHRCQLVCDRRYHAQREGGVCNMSVPVPETPIVGRSLVATE